MLITQAVKTKIKLPRILKSEVTGKETGPEAIESLIRYYSTQVKQN